MVASSDLLLLQQLKQELSPGQLQQFMLLYPARKKSVGAGILLALLFGLFGAHKFYLGDTKAGVIFLICGTIGWFLILPPIIIGVISLIDACQMGSTVQTFNTAAAMALKEEVKLLAS